MLRVCQIKLPVGHSEAGLRRALARALRVSLEEVGDYHVHKRSIDARGSQGVSFVYIIDIRVADEAAVLARSGRGAQIVQAPDESYRQLDGLPPLGGGGGKGRPVVVGAGPCGLFAALLLSRFGRRPILLERGKAAGDRARDVTGFWRRNWPFDPESNVQFGEGGAGTFSDGKLYTQIKDREHRIRWILREMVAAGAPEDILVKGKPHIGTDRLIRVVRNLREQIIANGGEVRFGARVEKFVIEDSRVSGVELAGGEALEAETVVVAVGHSARDTFQVLERAGVFFEPKSFSIGVRIEHPQALVDRAQFGELAGHPELGAAPYKFVCHCKNGRSAYSFCMCPGGLVVSASSEKGRLVTNGMSSYARAEANANSGLMVDVRPKDFGGEGTLAGIDYQRHWEEKAFVLGGSNYYAPVQTVRDFLAGRPSSSLGEVEPSYLPGVTPADLSACLPDLVVETLREAIPKIDRRLRGFAHPEAVMVGVETRSSSPLRMTRDSETFQSLTVRGLFPAGEGAGYAGGIISAAADGMRVAEQILNKL